MILDDKVKVSKKYNYHLDYYRDLGYDINQEFFIVKIEHLPKNSSVSVNVECDYCGYKEKISYSKWSRSMESPIKKYCCNNCKGEKIKESNLLKYGVSSVAKLESIKKKSKETNFKKRGVYYHTQSNIVKNKIKETNLSKYGVDNPMKSKKIREKQLETIVEKYGVDNISKLEYIKRAKKETTLSNFGVDIPIKSPEIKNKIKKTNLKKYGNEYFTKSEKFRIENYTISKDDFYLNYLSNSISLFKCDNNLDHNFEISKDVYSKRKLYGVSLCTVCNPINENRSQKEKKIYDFIKNLYDGKIISNYRDSKQEIDIYLPELKLGFEFNGLYWHCDIYKDKNFHLKKTNYFKERGIRIIHIWEDHWDNKSDIIKSQIKNLLYMSKRIFARNCKVRIIDKKICKKFLNKNHIQGNVNSVIKLGLFNNNELVSVMTFDHFEGRKKMNDNEWNLSRFCNKLNYNVIGGASKLLSFFLKNFKSNRIISYADKSWSEGNLYAKIGFSKIKSSGPDYKYIIKGNRVHKSRFKKSLTNISESNLNISKIWDCGKIKYEYIVNDKAI